jgi:hypothetical protein
VEPRLVSGTIISSDARGNAQVGKRSSDNIILKGSAFAINKQTLVAVPEGVDRHSPFGVLSYHSIEVGANRHQPRLVEFRVANGKHRRCCIDVRQLQPPGFTSAQSCAIE